MKINHQFNMSKVVVDNRLFSLSEWFEQINHKKTAVLRQEDNSKRERLEVLYQELGLLYDRPDKFPAQVVASRQPIFLEYLKNNAQRLCAFRLVPKDPSLPKLRLRGKSVARALVWFDQQNVDYSKYLLEIVPHNNRTLWSAIFLVKPLGITGEILPDGLSLLSQGNSKKIPIFFSLQF
jgi:hypothetical protein